MGVGAVIRMICRHWKGRIVLWTAPHLRIGPSDAIVFKYVWELLSVKNRSITKRPIGLAKYGTNPVGHAGMKRPQHS